MRTLTHDTILRMPKVLLHDHLDGGLRPATIVDLAGDVGLRRLPTTDPVELADWFHRGAARRDLAAVPRDLPAHRRGAADRRGAHPGGRASAPRTSPPTAWSTPRCASHPSCTSRRASRSTRWSTPCVDGFRKGSERTRHRDQARCSPPCDTTARLARDRRGRRPPPRRGRRRASTSPAARPATRRRRHLDAFQLVTRENFHITIHAGEAFGLPSIWEALQFCGAERLGHGVRIVDDIAERRPTAATSSVVSPRSSATGACRSRCAPRSNVHTGVAPTRSPSTRSGCCAAAVPRHGQHRQPPDDRRLDESRSSLC